MTCAHNIYIHVPFCKSKCNYCAFSSRACAAPDWDGWADNIISEIDAWATRLGRFYAPTIFFGGGTPSLMPVAIFARIINQLRTKFDVATAAEITIESNPGTLDAVRLREFVAAGVNRLSVGVQALDDDKLRFLGRTHSVRDARELLGAAMGMGLRVSADFIYGLPGDTAQIVVDMCRQINQIGLRHVSMYELTIEPDTPFGKMRLDMPANDKMADMYNAISDTLALPRYEVSNYATPGDECQHNMNIWDGAPYIGIGAHAAGRVFTGGTWYQQMGAGAEFIPISNTDRATEMLITGMRTVRGAVLDDMTRAVINMDWAQQNHDLVQIKSGRIAATEKGMLILDEILLNLTR